MKILGGQLKGRNFFMPAWIRPTQGLVRRALFDILGHDLEGATVLDLCAGSGAVGLEALSLGAGKVTFVEKDPRCAEIISENIKLLGIGDNNDGERLYEIIQTDIFAAIKTFARQNKRFDLVFIDPPYSRGMAKKSLKMLEAYDILHPNYTVVIQHEKKEILPEGQGRFLAFRQKKYGATILSIYKQTKDEIVSNHGDT